MLLYILRHGDPIYDPDCLTERGKLQAAALGKRLARYGIDDIYSSPLIRAQQTAEPTCILLGKKKQIEDWTSEGHAWEEFSIPRETGRTWLFHSDIRNHLRDKGVQELGFEWYKHPMFKEVNGEAGYKRILDASDEFLKRYGFIHDRENHWYKAEKPSDKRVAVFCHQGFGVTWLGTMLDIPLPDAWLTLDMGHTGMTVIEFAPDKDGICVPKILTLSNDSHLYAEGLPTKYQNRIFF